MGWKILSFLALLGIAALAYAGAVRTEATPLAALLQAFIVFTGGLIVVRSAFRESKT